MADLSGTIAGGLANYYENVAKELHRWVDPLSSEQFWRNPYPYGNSVGHLVLHLTGNLSYYIGARIAETGYVRTRDVEFTDAKRQPKAHVLRAFDDAVDLVLETIANQRPEDWTAAYSGVGEPDAHTRFDIFLHCAMHFYHHVGQLIYLREALMRR